MRGDLVSMADWGRSRIVTIALLVGIVSGCAQSTKMATNRASDYQVEPKRIFVVFHAVDDFGSSFDRAFLTKAAQLAKECGTTLDGTTISGLELDKNAYLTTVKTFNPDALLVVRRTGGTKVQAGALFHATFNVQMVEVKSNRTVWRAKADFYRGGTLIPIEQRGEALATDLTGKLKDDGILKCDGRPA